VQPSQSAKPANADERIVFLDRATISPETTVRRPDFPHRWAEFEATSADEVAERCADASIVILNKVPFRKAAIDRLPGLKMVAVAATGTDCVDIEACSARGIVVSNIRSYAVNTVPEHTFALILALRRSILAYRDSVRAGRWQTAGQFCYFDHPIRDLAGSTLGVIGDGALGQAVADLGRAFGMRILFSAYKGTTGMGPLYTPFEDVLRLSDVITLHSPLLPSTRNMIAAPEFALMQQRPLLINTARGGLVDESALHDALLSGQIAGAGFDVVTQEPPPADHPFMRLTGLPNFILTPHVAWASQQAIQSVADQLIENIEAFHAGTPHNVVLPESAPVGRAQA
jgi:glycerate dehydrogenase